MLKDPSARLRRAIKENNLFVVRRIIEGQDTPKDVNRRHIPGRIDMRNPDPGPNRYTSLAWAAVYGHEEIFEYLLNSGHDDEELSRDADNNTILTILAGLRSSTHTHTSSRPAEYNLQDVALRMARLYFERFPFLIDWSNVNGQTALHVAATKGNEDFVRMFCDLGADFDLPDLLGNTPLHYASMWNYVSVIQLLIERGCQFAARNNEGFTASDYAFSFSTMSTLQETARAQFESNKRARRNIFAQAAARGGERATAIAAGRGGERSKSDKEGELDLSRLRSGSGGSRTTSSTSDAAGGGDFDTGGLPPPPLPKLYSTSQLHAIPPSSSASLGVPRQTATLSPVTQRSAASTPGPPGAGGSLSPAAMANVKAAESAVASADFSALSPVASRMKERDADAIAEYMKRTRSGSGGGPNPGLANGSSAESSKPKQVSPASESAQLAAPVPSSSAAPSGPPSTENPAARNFRRLRPSNSAASLRPAGIIGMSSSALQQDSSHHGHVHSTAEIDLDFLHEALQDFPGGGAKFGSAKLGTVALPPPAPLPPGGGTKPLDIKPRYRTGTLESQNSSTGTTPHNGNWEGPPTSSKITTKELPPTPLTPSSTQTTATTTGVIPSRMMPPPSMPPRSGTAPVSTRGALGIKL